MRCWNRLLWSYFTLTVLVGRLLRRGAGLRNVAGQLGGVATLFVIVACSADDSSVQAANSLDVVEDVQFTQRVNEAGGFSQVISIDLVEKDALVLFVDGERVVVIDADGRTVSTASRVGSGPGEWRFVKWAGADSIGVGVVDVATLRLIRLFPDLSPATELSIASVVRGGAVVGRLTDGSFVSLIDPPTIPGTGRQRFLTNVVRWSAGAADVDTITRLPGTDVFIDPAEQMFVRVPGGGVDWVAARDSIIVAGNGKDDSLFVKVSNASGKWVRMQLPERKSRTSRAEIQAFVDAEVALVPREEDRLRMRRTFAKIRSESVAPRFERLVLDNRGHIWSAIGTDGDVRIWQVFSLTGESLAQFRLPARARPWIINNSTIVATLSDDDGFQRVVRYTVN